MRKFLHSAGSLKKLILEKKLNFGGRIFSLGGVAKNYGEVESCLPRETEALSSNPAKVTYNLFR
jgi:hypothetical protein